MEFVVEVLETVFEKSKSEAVVLMLRVHRRGSCVCGDFSKPIAEAKFAAVKAMAEKAKRPLQCTLEKE